MYKTLVTGFAIVGLTAGTGSNALAQDGVHGEADGTAVEMTLLTEFNATYGQRATNAALFNAIIRMIDEWDEKRGVTAAQAAELLAYTGSIDSNVVDLIEVRWCDGQRGVVAEVLLAPRGQRDVARSMGQTVWYVFKHRGKWCTLWKRHIISN